MEIKDIRIEEEEMYKLLGLKLPDSMYAYLSEDGDVTLNGHIKATKECKIPPNFKLEACLRKNEGNGIIVRNKMYSKLDEVNRIGYMYFTIYLHSATKYCEKIEEGAVHITLHPAVE